MTVVIADLPAEFSDTADAVKQLWLDVALEEVNVAWWTECGVDSDLGITLLASHYLKDAGEGSSESTGEGTVTSEAVDGVKVTYAVTSSSDSSAETGHNTTYGRAYDRLFARVERCRRTKPAAMFVSACPPRAARRRRNSCAC